MIYNVTEFGNCGFGVAKLDEEIYRAIDGDGEEIWADLILKEHFGVEE
jgi:hypothetical protein